MKRSQTIGRTALRACTLLVTLAALAMTATLPASEGREGNLIASYAFEPGDPGHDSSGNGLDLLIGSNVQVGLPPRDGSPGGAIGPRPDHQTGRAYVDVSEPINGWSFAPKSPDWNFTFEAWVKMEGELPETNRTLFLISGPGLSFSVFGTNEAKAAGGLLFRDGKHHLVRTGPLEWEAGVWYHVALVIAGDEKGYNDLFIYRARSGEKTHVRLASRNDRNLIKASEPGSGAVTFDIGNFRGGWGKLHFPGAMSEVHIYKTALDEAELDRSLE